MDALLGCELRFIHILCGTYAPSNVEINPDFG